MGRQVASHAGSDGQRMVTVDHLNIQHLAVVEYAEGAYLLQVIHQHLHIRLGDPANVETTQRPQTQSDYPQAQLELFPIGRPFQESAVEKGHDDAVGRGFVQPRRLRDLGYTLLGVPIVKR